MHVQLDAGDAMAFDGSGAVVFAQLLELIVDFAGYQGAQLDPAFYFFCGAHAHEALLALEDLDAISVLHRADAVVNRGDMVAEIGLGSGDIHGFAAADRAAVFAGGGESSTSRSANRRGQTQGEQTVTRVQEIQGLLFRMNLHYKPERRKEKRLTVSQWFIAYLENVWSERMVTSIVRGIGQQLARK